MHCSVLNLVFRGSTEAKATDDVINIQLPAIQQLRDAGELQVDNIDVFCEQGVFGIESTRQILVAGKNLGYEVNFHGDELHYTGSAEVRKVQYLRKKSRKGPDSSLYCVCRKTLHNWPAWLSVVMHAGLAKDLVEVSVTLSGFHQRVLYAISTVP